MRIEAVRSIRVENWGNTGPARIAPLPNPGVSSSAAATVQTVPATPLPYLEAFALPEVDAPDVDVQGFLSMTATLLKRMDQIQLWQKPPAQPESVDMSA
ncbi:MAG: hypothetical protein NTZ09_13395 [Candidatus Hydrogenedentes bacterium]|nr:hypothetical protein [Candidatus Hydrogenedentota bacterium]